VHRVEGAAEDADHETKPRAKSWKAEMMPRFRPPRVAASPRWEKEPEDSSPEIWDDGVNETRA